MAQKSECHQVRFGIELSPYWSFGDFCSTSQKVGFPTRVLKHQTVIPENLELPPPICSAENPEFLLWEGGKTSFRKWVVPFFGSFRNTLLKDRRNFGKISSIILPW